MRRSFLASVLLLAGGALADGEAPVLGKALQAAQRDACISQLKQIGLGLRLYEDREGKFPPNLEALFKAGDVADLKLFLCPRCGEKAGNTFKTHYVYLPVEKESDNPSLRIVVHDEVPCHLSGNVMERCVLSEDGSARAMSEEKFQELLKAQKAGK